MIDSIHIDAAFCSKFHQNICLCLQYVTYEEKKEQNCFVGEVGDLPSSDKQKTIALCFTIFVFLASALF